MSFDVGLGERLRLDVRGQAGVCDVQGIKPDGRLVISAPMGPHELPVILRPGETVGLSYVRGGGLFSFTAQVVDRASQDELEYYVVVFTSMITKSQRRGYVRLAISIPVGVRVLATGVTYDPISISGLIDKLARLNPSPMNNAPLYHTTTIDISGGGIAFASNIPFEPNTLLSCEMEVEGQPFRSEGIVRSTDEDPTRDPRYKVSAQFVDIDARQQRRVIKFLMDEEIRSRRTAQ